MDGFTLQSGKHERMAEMEMGAAGARVGTSAWLPQAGASA